MIVRKGLDLVRLVRHVGPLLGVLLAYDIALTVAYVRLGWRWLAISDLPLPLLGSAVVLVITLRNNAAYARWWEARTLWGAVVNNSRSIARGLQMLTADAALRRELVRYQIAYALALRCHLLKRPPWKDIEGYVPDETLERLRGVANVPAAIQDAMAGALRRGGMGSIGLSALDATLSALANAQGGLERIKNTPLARQYMQFPMVFSRVYCLLLPVGLLSDLGVLTPVGSTVIGFMFLALDRIGKDLEDPFEGRVHDIPMAAIVRTIEIDLLQSIGASDVPEPITVKDGIIW